MNGTIAIPSTMPGGMDAPLGAHFGHCDLYTLVQVTNDEITETKVIPNVPHQQGGCMAPVQHLASHGVDFLIAGGMGMRPLMGFNQVGIQVFFGGNSTTVGQAVNAFLAGSLPRFTQDFTCGGGGGQMGGLG